jgi:Rab-like protein 3
MATFDRVRILVLGDSGVGKTSLVHLMSQGQPLRQLSYTIGATVEVKLHEYREGTPAQKTFWIGRNILHFRIIFAESYSGFSDG